MKGEDFISRAVLIHDNKYDYSNIEYINNQTKVNIICKEHGVFIQRPKNHLDGQGCRKCFIESLFLNTKIFIERSTIIHQNRYDYSLVDYVNNYKKVRIICKEHGEFLQSPNNHLNTKQGCPMCKFKNSRVDFEHFVKKSTEKHGNKYKYNNINPEEFRFSKKVKIICETHGEFLQLPNNHYNLGYGCFLCKESKGEIEISKLLEELNIKHIREYKFDTCRNRNKLIFDFYLPEMNICIEFQGLQHFKPISHFGGDNRFKKQIINDSIKSEWCIKNNIKLIIISYLDNIKEVIIREFKNNKHKI